MQNPLEITFHDTRHSPEIEQLIREKFEKIKGMSPDISKCHVIVEKLSKHHKTGNTACVRMDLKVPHFSDIVVAEKCTEDEISMMAAANKVLKRGAMLMRKEINHRREGHRTPRDTGETVFASDAENVE